MRYLLFAQLRGRRSLAELSLIVALLPGCGPRVFGAGSTKVIESVVPPVVEEPEPEPRRVEVTEEAIVIHEKIQFAYNAAEISAASDSLLAEIAEVIRDHPEIAKIRIEGHASSEGRYRHNMDLSKRRARAVLDYLVEHGQVDPGRLESEGYGPDQPIADNDTEAGREANRRVEFKILERSPDSNDQEEP